MKLQSYAISKHRTIITSAIENDPDNGDHTDLAMSINHELLRNGYVLSNKAYETLSKCSVSSLEHTYGSVCAAVKELSGKRSYKPFYHNFPEHVIEATDFELLVNAVIHYWTDGTWLPPTLETNKLPRSTTTVKPTILNVGDLSLLPKWTTQLLSSNNAMSPRDREFLFSLKDEMQSTWVPKEIPFKENLCIVASIMLDRHIPIDNVVSTTTDALRVLVYYSDQNADLTLSSPPIFKSLSRKRRRLMVDAIKKVARLEDFDRHRGYWVRALHMLHIGDFVKPTTKFGKMIHHVRSNKKIETYNGTLQKLYDADDQLAPLLDHLQKRPGVFARWLCAVLRKNPTSTHTEILQRFEFVAREIPTNLLITVIGALRQSSEDQEKLMYVPKGRLSSTKIVDITRLALPNQTVRDGQRIVMSKLISRFGASKPPMMDEVYTTFIDPALYACKIPGNMRNATEGKRTIPRGTSLPFNGEGNTIRAFVYWSNMTSGSRVDVDLSAAFYSESGEAGVLNYHNLRQPWAVHSGDITNAPNGACEYVDINIQKALDHGVRYVMLDLKIFTSQVYKDLPECRIGWMMLDKSSSQYEHFDAKSVIQSVDVDHDSETYIPAVFDLEERRVVWLDVVHLKGISGHSTSIASQTSMLHKYLSSMLDTKHEVSLGELIKMHAIANNITLTERPDEAQLVFSSFPEKSNWITPFDYSTISSELLK